MFDFSRLHNKMLAVLLVEGYHTDDGRWTMLLGQAKWEDGHLYVHRGMDVPEFPIPDDTLDRIRRVPPEEKEFFAHADYCTLLTVAPLPPEADLDDLEHTGLTLPKDAKDFDVLL